MDEVIADGQGHVGRYRFVRSTRGWCLVGRNGQGFLTPGIGVPMHYETKEELLEVIGRRWPKLRLKACVSED